MGLKELKSDLTSLDYPDGGTWLGGPNQRPLMTKPLIDFADSTVGGIVDTFTGGFIRGGAATHVERNLTDTARIGKFLITPKGVSFIAKQVGLQLSNPRMDVPMADLISVSDANQRTYNLGVNTLASVATAGTGIKFAREGLIPGVHKGYIDAKGGILGTGTNLFADDKDPNRPKNKRRNKQENRLLYLFQDKIEDDTRKFSGKGEELYSYGGGPKSLYGIGKTTIRRYTDTGGAISYKNHELNGKTNIQNFLKTVGKPYFDYSKRTKDQNRYFNRESRIGLGNPGAKYVPGGRDSHISQKNKDGSLNYNVYSPERTDKVNMLDIVEGTNNDFTGDGFRDLVRFRFEAIKHAEPTKAEAMIFRAFLDDFNDSYSANHNEVKYNGRAESFYTYNSFNREISLSFKIAAQSRHEMMPLYRKLNFLASNTAPEYHEGGRIMTPYIRLTVGSYLNRVPGVIKSIGIKWQKDYPWEIAIDSPEKGMDSQDSHMLVLPHVLDVSVSFQPIHNFLPQKSVSDSPFILPHWDQRDGTLNPEQKWLLPGAQNKNEAGLLGVDKLSRLNQIEPEDIEEDTNQGRTMTEEEMIAMENNLAND